MTGKVNRVTTMEAFMFASIDSNKGKLLHSRAILIYGAAGIALAELAERGRISIENRRVAIKDASSIGDLLLDELLDVIGKKGSHYRLNSLISSMQYKVKRFGKRLLENLEDNGMVRIEQGRFLGLIPYNRYIVTQVHEHTRLVEELKEIVLSGNRMPEPRKAMLISMLHTCSVLRRRLDSSEYRQAKEVLKQIGKGQFFDSLSNDGRELQKAVKMAITAAQTAAS